jgi:hypothetical protein
VNEHIGLTPIGWCHTSCILEEAKKLVTPRTFDPDRCAACGKHLPPFYLVPGDSPGGYVCPRCDGQLQKWKEAIAKNHRQQRQRRGKRGQDASQPRIDGPGMIRRPAPRPRND